MCNEAELKENFNLQVILKNSKTFTGIQFVHVLCASAYRGEYMIAEFPHPSQETEGERGEKSDS